MYLSLQSVFTSPTFRVRFLIFPAMLGGGLAGWIIKRYKAMLWPRKGLRIRGKPGVLALTFCAGLLVFGAKWQYEALDSSAGLFQYLSKLAAQPGSIVLIKSTEKHEAIGTPFWFWFVFILEGVGAVASTMKVAGGDPLFN